MQRPPLPSPRELAPRRVRVVVVTWNGLPFTLRCLESLARQTFTDFETVLVDNGSQDGTPEVVSARFPGVQLLRNEINRGFAAACNQGAAAAQAEFLATLNNDAAAQPTWLEELVRAAHARPDLGMFASKLLLDDGSGRIDSTGICIDRLGFAWDRRAGEPDTPPDEPAEVFGPCAAAALYRRSLWEDVGPLDEGYFTFLEDVDLAWRARRRGWRCLYVPSAVAYHRHSATAGEGSPLKSYLLARNKLWLVAKNYPRPQLWRYLPLLVAYDLLALAYRLLTRGDAAALRGRWDALRGLAFWYGQGKIWQGKATPEGERRTWELLQSPQPPWRVWARYRYLKGLPSVGTGPRP